MIGFGGNPARSVSSFSLLIGLAGCGGGNDTPATPTDSGQVTTEDLVVGSGATAATGDTLTVHYTGWLADGTKFDSSYDRGTPYVFVLGASQVIRGWDMGIPGMKVGGKRRLVTAVARLRQRGPWGDPAERHAEVRGGPGLDRRQVACAWRELLRRAWLTWAAAWLATACAGARRGADRGARPSRRPSAHGPTMSAARATGRRAGSSASASRRTVASQPGRRAVPAGTRARAQRPQRRSALAQSGRCRPSASTATTSNTGPSL